MRRVSETILLNGTALAARIREGVLERANAITAERGRPPRIVTILASDDASAASYVQSKTKTAEKAGMQFEIRDLGAGATQQRIDAVMDELSGDRTVDAIVLELPLARGIDPNRVLDRLDPAKDVDGLTATNLGRLLAGRTDGIVAATPQACVELAETFAPLSQRTVAVVGRGRTVGRPLAALLLQRDATPLICHSRTERLEEAVRFCDVVIVAVGRAGLAGASMLRAGQIVIDAGINVAGGSVRGDVDRAAAESAGVAALSPVPGGVGPVTTAILFRNVLRAIELQQTA